MKGTILIILILLTLNASGEENQNTVILKNLDLRLHPSQDIVCEIHITTYDETSALSVKKFNFFADSTSDQFLLICISPIKEQGFARGKRKDQIWSYSPLVKRFFSSTGYDFLEGTALRTEDFLPDRYDTYYTVDTTIKTEVNKNPALKLLLKAKSTSSPYDNITVWLDEKSLLPVREEAYDSESHLLKVIMYSGYREKDGWYQASSILVTDMTHSSITSYIDIKQTTLSEVPEYVFTRSFVEFITQ
ncbi:MAG: outer membrane lipoprotein-sorting protein [Spirochaetales bacterium]|nr:outer membrane lipoprotein-sorting protein [Spirochaetales bacterium]